jgi:hypothetical protein
MERGKNIFMLMGEISGDICNGINVNDIQIHAAVHI